MARIVLIDDDFAMSILAESLQCRGHDVERIRSASEVLEKVEHVTAADIVILDMIMEPPGEPVPPESSAGRNTGLQLFRALRKRRSDLPVLVYSASQDGAQAQIFADDPKAAFLQKWGLPSMAEIQGHINRLTGTEQPPVRYKSFIVHGHDQAAKLDLKNYLQNTLKLPEPIILHEQPSLGRTIIEKFEAYASEACLAFVLLTPDDRGASDTDGNDEKRRARQNVIFELGYFLGTIGRKSGRVFLLHKGPLELPSDLNGIVYIDISSGIAAAGEQIRLELTHATK